MSGPEDERGALRVFAWLWAAGTLFHVGSFDLWSESLLVALGATWLLVRPGSVPVLLSFSVLQLADVWIQLPIIPNHWLFAAFVDAALIAAFAVAAFASGSLRVDAAALYRSFAPPVRVGVLVMYGFAVLHKLNTDFLSPAVSCASEFYRAQAAALPFVPGGDGFEALAIFATLGTEIAIPLLLVPRATRSAGIALGLLFHGFLAFNPISGFYNFSAILVALYALFAPPAALNRAAAGLESVLASGAEDLRALPIAGLAVVTLLAGAGLFAASELYARVGSRSFFLVLWVPYGLLTLGLAARHLPWRGAAADGGHLPRALRIHPPLLAALPLLLAANGATPYLGLKTELSFSMFSNLRTEGGRTNHLFVPTATQLFDYQRDLVRILETGDPGMRAVAQLDRVLPYVEFRNHMSGHADARIAFERGGRRVELERAGDDPELVRPLPLAARKLLSFRTIDRVGPQRCVH